MAKDKFKLQRQSRSINIGSNLGWNDVETKHDLASLMAFFCILLNNKDTSQELYRFRVVQIMYDNGREMGNRVLTINE